MKRRKAVVCTAVCLVCLTGCGRATPDAGEAARQTEISRSQGEEAGRADGAGTGFKPPQGSHVDKNGNIVDREGNTFDAEGGWQVPEGGHVDASGRIIDKNGNVMGGGATVGSKG